MSNPPDSGPPRPRNRRQPSRSQGASSSTSTSLLDISPAPSERTSRATSPFQAPFLGNSGRNSPVNTAINRASGLLDAGWSSVAGFASSLLGDQGNARRVDGKASHTSSIKRQPSPWSSASNSKTADSTRSRPRIKDVAAGAMSDRELTLRAMKTASVLESHDGVNGGLDVAGRFKRRTSDEILPSLASHGSNTAADQLQDEGCLVYIHNITSTDTYPGLVLKYRCRDDAIKKANGLSNVSHLYIRRHVFVPVDACEVKGRPCEPPSYANAGKVDLLAPTPGENTEESSLEGPAQARGNKIVDYFSPGPSTGPKEEKGEEKPWEHVRWVKIDGFSSPVEIGRVPRKLLGYYPPRRKKSIFSDTVSEASTPRQSVDMQSLATTGASRPSIDLVNSPGSMASRRRGNSVLSTSRHSVSTGPGRNRNSMGSFSMGDDPRQAWMRGPGGVGTLGRNVNAPGPQDDVLNKWARKHFAQLTVDNLPSMSVLGSEMARFGFSKDGESAEIAQGGDGIPYLEGAPADGGGIKFDKMAIGIEAWLRGAWQNRASVGTPILGPRRREESDLIELEDASDDGRLGSSLLAQDLMLDMSAAGSGLGPGVFGGTSAASGSAGIGGSSGWSVSSSTAQRSRSRASTYGKERKSD